MKNRLLQRAFLLAAIIPACALAQAPALQNTSPQMQNTPKMENETIRYCQSCGMPLTKPEDLGTEADRDGQRRILHLLLPRRSLHVGLHDGRDDRTMRPIPRPIQGRERTQLHARGGRCRHACLLPHAQTLAAVNPATHCHNARQGRDGNSHDRRSPETLAVSGLFFRTSQWRHGTVRTR